MLVPITQRNAENGKIMLCHWFYQGMVDSLLYKRKLSDVVEKSIPKNIDRDLKQKM